MVILLTSNISEMICNYTECLVGNKMNPIRRKRIEREQFLLAKNIKSAKKNSATSSNVK